jgi:hypothetical protein
MCSFSHLPLASRVHHRRVVDMMLHLLRNSRHAAAVALLALIAGPWLSCSCAEVAIAVAQTGHESTTVQDPHACCVTNDGLRADPTCCSESTFRESAVVASAIGTDSMLTPATHATGMAQTVPQRVTPVPALAAAGATRPPRTVILRI